MKKKKRKTKSKVRNSRPTSPIATTNKNVRFYLLIILSYLFLIFIVWLFFSCPKAIKITISSITGLIVSLIAISIDIKGFKGVEFRVLHRITFAILIGIISIFTIYIYAFSISFIRDFYSYFKCSCECNCIEIPLKIIPAGTYDVGISGTDEKNILNLFPSMGNYLHDEKPQHSVLLDSFLISEYEITNGIYSCFAKEKKLGFAYKQEDKLKPKTNISWHEAIEFCRWLEKKIGRKVKLPTEAQWEVAAGTHIFPWGDDYPQINTVNFSSAFKGTTPVDSIKNYSYFEVINMAGNAAEWCMDFYGDYSNSTIVCNPQGSTTGTKRVVRGGSWNDNAFNIRVSKRNSYLADTKKDNIGFRIVISNNLNYGGKNYEKQIFQFIDSRNAVIIINGM